MAQQTVYYNYSENIIQGVTNNSLKTAISSSYASKISNVKYNDVTYFLQNIYFYRPSGSNNVWLVLQNTSDPNMSSGTTLFLAIQLKTGAEQSSDIDAFLAASSSPINANLNLNGHLVDGDKAKVTSDDATKSVTVTIKTPIGIKTALSKNTPLYTSTIQGVSGLEDVTNDNANATIQKSILDWTIDCQLEGEDTATETSAAVKNTTSDIMDNINMVMAFVLIIGGAYIATPEIYTWFIVPIIMSYDDTAAKKPFTSMSIFWYGAFLLMIIEMIILGASGKGSIFYLLAIGLTLLIFSANKALEDAFFGGRSLDKAPNVTVNSNTIENDPSWFSLFKFNLSEWQSYAKWYCIIGMLGVVGTNLASAFADITGKDEKGIIGAILSSFPNYFLYAITFTALCNKKNDMTTRVVQGLLLLICSGWFAASMVTTFQK